MSPARVPMDDAHLFQYAVNTARALRPVRHRRARALARQIKRDLERCAQTQERLSARGGGAKELTGAERWLLDNYYLAAREGEQARRCFAAGGKIRGAESG